MFVKPCQCRGSMRYIHRSCLELLRKSSKKYHVQCPTCKYKYQFRRIMWSNIIMHPVTTMVLSIITISVIFATIYTFLYQVMYFFGALMSMTRLPRLLKLSSATMTHYVSTWSFFIVGVIGIVMCTLLQDDDDQSTSFIQIFYNSIEAKETILMWYPWSQLDFYTYVSFGWVGLFAMTYKSLQIHLSKLTQKGQEFILNVDEKF